MPEAAIADEFSFKLLVISARTLQRHLQEEGVLFNDILDLVRRDLAGVYLANRNITLHETACLLGFSEQSSFSRASHRWFNEAPSKVRAELLSSPNLLN